MQENMVVSSRYGNAIAGLSEVLRMMCMTAEEGTAEISGETFYTTSINNVTETQKSQIKVLAAELADKYLDINVTCVKIDWSQSGFRF